MIAQRLYYDTTLALPINIYFNYGLYEFFLGFRSITYYLSQGRDAQILVGNQYNNWYNPPYILPVQPPDYYNMVQDYASIYSWSPVESIVITSRRLPVNSVKTSESSNSFENIILSYKPSSDQEANRHIYSYRANGQYILTDVLSNVPLYEIDFAVTFLDKFGNVYKVEIQPEDILNMKFVFIKKDLYKTYGHDVFNAVMETGKQK